MQLNLDRIGGWWREVGKTVLAPDPAPSEDVREAALTQAPVIWLVGMVGAGKSSIIRTLTGSSEAEIGTGFRPCTRTARIYDFPAEVPVVRFLDTRGLGEVDYDPGEDLALCEQQSHLVMAVLRGSEPVPPALLETLATIRRRHPGWPLLVAQTTLHDAYPGNAHPDPYPFGATGEEPSRITLLDRSLAAQREALRALPGRGAILFAPIDFTLPEDGLSPPDYGLDRLWAALESGAFEGVAAMLRKASKGDALTRRARAHVQGYAVAAGTIDLVPVAGAVGVPVVQGKMLHSLAALHGVAWTGRTLGEFAASLGAGVLLRQAGSFGLRQVLKLIPGIGQIIGAAAAGALSFVVTYGLGHAAILYLAARRRGGSVDREEVAAEFRRAMAEAGRLAKSRRMFEKPEEARN